MAQVEVEAKVSQLHQSSALQESASNPPKALSSVLPLREQHHNCNSEKENKNRTMSSAFAPTRTVTAGIPQLSFGNQHTTRTFSSPWTPYTADRLHPFTPIHNCGVSSAGAFANSPGNSESESPGSISFASNAPGLTPSKMGDRSSTPTPASVSKKQPRPSSLPATPRSRKLSPKPRSGTPHPHGKPSVKHLTCFWWKEKGDCRFSEEDCLYAHHDTGLYADPPRQVTPGEPAMAGRSLERALRKLQIEHSRSSCSLKSMSDMSHITTTSRPATPVFEQIPASPVVLEQLHNTEAAFATVQKDNVFLRNLVEQNTKEKSVLVNTVDSLQEENKSLKNETAGLKTENAQMKHELDVLQRVVNSLQPTQAQHDAFKPFNKFGPIGRNF